MSLTSLVSNNGRYKIFLNTKAFVRNIFITKVGFSNPPIQSLSRVKCYKSGLRVQNNANSKGSSSKPCWRQYRCRWNLFENMVMDHNWHWVSVIGTNVKIHIFGTLPATIKKNLWRFFKHEIYRYYLYLFSKIRTVRGYAFLIKPRAIFIKIHVFAFSYISRIRNKYGFWSKPGLENINNSSQNTLSLLLNINFFL